jgi:hypothetical protein
MSKRCKIKRLYNCYKHYIRYLSLIRNKIKNVNGAIIKYEVLKINLHDKLKYLIIFHSISEENHNKWSKNKV